MSISSMNSRLMIFMNNLKMIRISCWRILVKKIRSKWLVIRM